MIRGNAQRVDPVQPGSDPEFDAIAADMIARGVHVSNLARTLGRQPDLMRVAGAHSAALSSGTSIPKALVELAICRTAVAAGGEYPFAHHAGKALDAGVDEAKLAAIADVAPGPPFSEAEQVVLRAVDEIEAGRGLSDSVVGGVFQHFTQVQLLELVQLVAFYSGLVRIVAALQIPVDDDKAAWVDEYWSGQSIRKHRGGVS